jgi:hypothetical protein
MHIIVVSDRLAKARSIEFSIRHLVLGGIGLATGFVVLAILISYLGVRHAAELKLPMLQSLVLSAQQAESERNQDFLRQNLNAMAVKLGEMQAQLMRLDALGERLSTVAGVRPSDFRFGEIPGRGGAAVVSVPMHDLSLGDFSRQLDFLARQTETRSDLYGVLESQLLDARVKQKLTPTALPVTFGSWNASGFGWRIDPITGLHRRDRDADPRRGGGRGDHRRVPARLRQHGRDRPRQRPRDALRARVQAARQGRAARQERGEDRRGRHHRPLHRVAPPFRGPPQGRGAEPDEVPAQRDEPRGRSPVAGRTRSSGRGAAVGHGGCAPPGERR